MKKGIIMEVNKRFLTVLTPNGEFLRARKSNANYQIGQEIEFFPVVQGERKKIPLLNIFPNRVVLAAAVALMLVFISSIPFYQNNQVYAYVSIDINPSIELGVNKKHQVIELVPFNDDGEQIVRQIHGWKNEDAKAVINDVINEIKKQGYMKNKQKMVLATVYTEKENRDKDKLWKEEIADIKEVIQEENLELIVVEGTQEERKEAKEEGLTTGLYKEKKLKVNRSKSEHIEKPVPAAESSKQDETPDITEQPKHEEKAEPIEESTPHTPPGQIKKEDNAGSKTSNDAGNNTSNNASNNADNKAGMSTDANKEQTVPSKQENVNEKKEKSKEYKEKQMDKESKENNGNGNISNHENNGNKDNQYNSDNGSENKMNKDEK